MDPCPELVSVPLHHGQPDPPGPDGGLHLKRCLVSGYTTSFKQRMQCHQRIHTDNSTIAQGNGRTTNIKRVKKTITAEQFIAWSFKEQHY
ncbi:uncharacterized protein LOC119187263 isoform X2 [Rhipicephalus microplus]|uniref:uncharacterized protein LOC119187263 isoform X2 n=1 Tax=Rhipicephalus microplus TaxID=6941 RepID=UPI003F6CC491